MVLNADYETARKYHSEIRTDLKRSGKPIPTNDLWIAAIARQYDFPLVSRDQHFLAVRGLRVLGW